MPNPRDRQRPAKSRSKRGQSAPEQAEAQEDLDRPEKDKRPREVAVSTEKVLWKRWYNDTMSSVLNPPFCCVPLSLNSPAVVLPQSWLPISTSGPCSDPFFFLESSSWSPLQPSNSSSSRTTLSYIPWVASH